MRADQKLTRMLGAGVCLLALGIGLVAMRPARAWLTSGGAGAAAFSSAGDVASFTAWWGASFAYSSATRGTKAVNLCNGGVCADVNSDATTGIVTNAPTINAAACNNSTHICTIHTVYDKVGTADMVQATGGNQPVWVVDGFSAGIPCAGFTRASSQFLATTGGTPIGGGNSSFIVSAVVKRNIGQSANQNAIMDVSAAGGQLFYHEHSADNVTQYGNNLATVQTVAAADGAFHAANGIWSNIAASTYLRVDGTTASGANITIGAGTAATQCIGAFGSGGVCGGSGLYDGRICEVGIINSIFTQSIADNLNTNQHSSVRYNF